MGPPYLVGMKTFPLVGPLDQPGIYAVINNRTGHLYIGRSMSLRRRYAEWKGVFTNGLGCKNQHIQQSLLNGETSDWSFNILFEFPKASEGELAAYENRSIRHIYNQSPTKLLNFVETPFNIEVKAGPSAKTTLTFRGNAISQTEAAKVLSCNVKTLSKRLYSHREQGRTEVTVEQLQELSQKYRSPKPQCHPPATQKYQQTKTQCNPLDTPNPPCY